MGAPAGGSEQPRGAGTFPSRMEWVLEKHFLEKAEAGRQSRKGRRRFPCSHGEEEMRKQSTRPPQYLLWEGAEHPLPRGHGCKHRAVCSAHLIVLRQVGCASSADRKRHPFHRTPVHVWAGMVTDLLRELWACPGQDKIQGARALSSNAHVPRAVLGQVCSVISVGWRKEFQGTISGDVPKGQ